MAAPSGALCTALLLVTAALALAGAVSEPTTVPFDVRPGGVVHSFSQDVGPGGKFTCTFTYASQGGTNEQWQMSLGTSEDSQHFTCTIWRPQGKSYLYFTQFKAEVRGAEIEYAMAYVSASLGDLRTEGLQIAFTARGLSHPADAQGSHMSWGPSGLTGFAPGGQKNGRLAA
ncbi:Myeloid-derived growth factor [Lemmus lemmus]